MTNQSVPPHKYKNITQLTQEKKVQETESYLPGIKKIIREKKLNLPRIQLRNAFFHVYSTKLWREPT